MLVHFGNPLCQLTNNCLSVLLSMSIDEEEDDIFIESMFISLLLPFIVIISEEFPPIITMFDMFVISKSTA